MRRNMMGDPQKEQARGDRLILVVNKMAIAVTILAVKVRVAVTPSRMNQLMKTAGKMMKKKTF